MAFELMKLPYPLDALTPHISEQTLHFHYEKHHKNYVTTLNELIAGTKFENKSLEEIMEETNCEELKIFNNAAQVWNHNFMWNCLTPKPQTSSKTLKAAITNYFGSVEDFQQHFYSVAKSHFGSGWVWLVKDKFGELQLRALSNAENPLLDGETPLFACDVWEHAYYLDYQNERSKYLEHYWYLINWDFVESNMEKSVEKAISPRRENEIGKEQPLH